MKRTRLAIDPLMIALVIPAAFFGYFYAIVLGLICILIHELSHVFTAHLCGIHTERIDMTPFGGLAAMENAPTPRKAFLIALAGPLANLLLAQLLLLLFKAYPANFVKMLIIANLGIGLFNLLPAYPLDGGRMLHALLSPLMGYERSKRLCCYLGMLLGGLILAFAIFNAFMLHIVNISFLFVGAILMFMADRQITSDVYTALKQSQKKRKMLHSRPIEARQIAANEETAAMDLLKKLQKGQYMTAYVLDEAMKVRGILDETQILDGIVRYGSTCTLKKILDHRQSLRVN